MKSQNSSEEIAITVDNVSKNFALPHERVTSVKGHVTRLFRGNRTIEVQHALRNISFDIKKGEFFGIVGRNGGGKSTLLKILAGIYQPTKGSINVKGKLVPFIELGVGFNPELTGRENVYLNGALLGFSKKEMDEQYEQIVAFAELEDFMDQKLKNYSSGMQVRLAFSVAIIADADILLVDEVLAVGDADFQRKCFQYFKSLKKNKKTVVFVSHDMSAVREFCDRALLIEGSKLVKDGAPDDVASLYTQLFIEQDASDTGAFVEKDQKRWGDGRATFTKTQVAQKTLTPKQDLLQFSTTITAHKDVEELVVGSAIKSASGEAICGTNTQHKKVKITKLKSGDQLQIDWSYPNIFADGKYTIDIAVHGFNDQDVADWWSDAMGFRVRKEEHTPHLISPDIGLAVHRISL